MYPAFQLRLSFVIDAAKPPGRQIAAAARTVVISGRLVVVVSALISALISARVPVLICGSCLFCAAECTHERLSPFRIKL